MVNGVIEGMQQKHEKVILFTKENDRTQKGRSRVTGKRKNKGVVGRQASRRHSGRELAASTKLSYRVLEGKGSLVKGMSRKLFSLMCKVSVH